MASVVLGVALILLGLTDVFLTVLNYDGFSFIASRVYRHGWTVARAIADHLPVRAARLVLSLTAPAMLPLTVAIWLGLEMVGFALVFQPAMDAGWFSAEADTEPTFGQALYLSGVTISTLGYGEITPHTDLTQTLAVLEALIGFAILTVTISYVLATFRVLERVRTMSDTLRHVLPDSTQPARVIGDLVSGRGSGLERLLERVHDDLQAYDEGLRIYPIVYYFHTREPERSTPYMFGVLGDFVGALRYATPRDLQARADPWLRALAAEYEATMARVMHSFLRVEMPEASEPLPRDEFERVAFDRDAHDPWVERFLELEHDVALALGESRDDEPWCADRYERYVGWLSFAHAHATFLNRLTADLGYARDFLPAEHLITAAD